MGTPRVRFEDSICKGKGQKVCIFRSKFRLNLGAGETRVKPHQQLAAADLQGPALNRLMDDAKKRRIDAVLVWKLDRFGQSLRHLVNVLAELEALNVAFVSLRGNLDLSTPSGRLMFPIIGAMAEFERALIQERVKAGLPNAQAKGKRLGRPRVFVSESKVEALRASGASWRSIAKELGLGVGTVRRTAGNCAKNVCGAISERTLEVLNA